jgi:cytochrome c-type biogenesis protein CcmH
MKIKLTISILIIFILSMMFVSGVLAQDPAPAPTPSIDEVNDIAKNMFCPVCENIPLDVCGTEACEMWREEISDLLILGFTEDEVYEYFYERHGDMVLATPRATGFNLVLYILPVVAIVLGIVFFVRYLRTTTKNVENEIEKIEIKAEKKADPYQNKLEDELKKRN